MRGRRSAPGWMWEDVTPGLFRNRGVGESKVIRLLSIIHNGIILDLVCGFGGGVC